MSSITGRSVSSLEYKRVRIGYGTQIVRVEPKPHMSKKDRKRLKASLAQQRTEATESWLDEAIEDQKGEQNGESENSSN